MGTAAWMKSRRSCSRDGRSAEPLTAEALVKNFRRSSSLSLERDSDGGDSFVLIETAEWCEAFAYNFSGLRFENFVIPNLKNLCIFFSRILALSGHQMIIAGKLNYSLHTGPEL